MPSNNTTMPTPKIQPVIGSKSASSIPSPKPIIQTPKVFLSKFISTSHTFDLVYNMLYNLICYKKYRK